MKIWKLSTLPDDYALFYTLDDTDKDERMDYYFRFDGRSMQGEKVPKLSLSEDREKGDFPNLVTGIPVFSDRAVAVLEDLLAGATELFPFECDGGRYYIVNVTNVVECLDREKSHICFYKCNPGKIMDIEKFVFKRERLAGQHIFKIPEIPLADVFVSDTFAERLRHSELKGYKLVEMWDSEEE